MQPFICILSSSQNKNILPVFRTVPILYRALLSPCAILHLLITASCWPSITSSPVQNSSRGSQLLVVLPLPTPPVSDLLCLTSRHFNCPLGKSVLLAIGRFLPGDWSPQCFLSSLFHPPPFTPLASH